MEEDQVQREILAPYLNWVFAAHKTKVAAQFDQELLQFGQQAAMKVALGMVSRKLKEFDQIRVLEHFGGLRMQNSQRC